MTNEESLSPTLSLPRLHQATTISGVAGLKWNSLQALTNITVLSCFSAHKFTITAVVVPPITCDLPIHPVLFGTEWTHLDHIHLADPNFGSPGRIDLLLRVNIITEALLHGWRAGSPGTPAAFETVFGWVLAGPTNQTTTESFITSCHALTTSGDDLL